MIIGSLFLKNSLDNFVRNKENFGDDSMTEQKSMSMIIISTVIVLVEIALFYFAVDIAINVTTSNSERFVHIMLALLFTMPYLLAMVVFSEPAKLRLQRF